MRHKRLHQLSNQLEEESSINLTPLIDVVFVILIMFILIAPMLEVDRISLATAPSKEQSEIPNASSLMIHVQQDNSILINKKEIDGKSLGPILKALYVKNPKLVPQLYQDKAAFFGTYQQVKNAVEEAGFEELDVVLKNETH